jgi:acetyltransferase-like isoleucine patch superfamily enzyme
MFYLLEQFERHKARKLGVRLSDIHDFRNRIPLFIEENVRLSDITVDIPETVIPQLSIGAYSYIRSQSLLMAVSSIGRFCSIGRNVVIGQDPRNHPIDWVSTSPVFNHGYDSQIVPVEIGHDVWIGHNAVIFAGVKIGHGAVIGMNAVVTKDVAPYSIVGGNPAKPIRSRFEDPIVEKLLKSNWWNYSVDELKQYQFSNPNLFAEQSHLLKQTANYKQLIVQNRKVIFTNS